MASSARISVIIPVYNDPEGVRATLESLLSQRETPPYEVAVVDNDSTDNTKEVISEFETQHPDIVRYLSETDVQSSYAARNTGIKHTSGDVVVFIDADMTVRETWITDIYEAFHDSDVDYLGYNVKMYVPRGEDTLWAEYDVAMGLPVGHYLRNKNFAPTCALAVRREVFDIVGCFDENLVSGGDKEFGGRVHDAELSMEYESDIVVCHPARTTFRSHTKKAARIGKGQAQLWKHYRLATSPLSPVRFLPPSISRIKKRKQSAGDFVLIFVLEYFFKIIQSIHSILYVIRRRRVK